MIVVLSILLIGTAIGIVYYWVDFYAKGGLQLKTQSIEREFFVNRKRGLDETHFDKICFWAKIEAAFQS